MAASLFQRRTDSVFLFSLQCPGIETMVETVRASRNASAELSFAPHHVGNGFIRSACYGFVGNSRSGYRNKRIGIGVYAPPKKRIHPFRLPRFCRHFPVGQPQKLYWYQRKGAIKKVPQAHHNYSLLIIHHSLFIGAVTDRPFCLPLRSLRGRHLEAHYCSYGYVYCGVPVRNNGINHICVKSHLKTGRGGIFSALRRCYRRRRNRKRPFRQTRGTPFSPSRSARGRRHSTTTTSAF